MKQTIRIFLLIAGLALMYGLAFADYDFWLTTNVRTNVTLFTVTSSTFNGFGVLHSVSISSACFGAANMTLYDSRGNATPTKSTQFIMGPIGANSQFQYFYDVAFSSGLTLTTTGLNGVSGCGYEVQYKTPIR